MRPYSKRDPKFCDEALSDLSKMLTADIGAPTFGREFLNPSQLDYTVESLRLIDAYLDHVRESPPSGDDFVRLVLRCGAYVGEVLRRQSEAEFHWLTYEAAAAHSDMVKSLGKEIGTVAILWAHPDSYCFPLAKVCKYLENGPRDSVHFFVTVLLERVPGDSP